MDRISISCTSVHGSFRFFFSLVSLYCLLCRNLVSISSLAIESFFNRYWGAPEERTTCDNGIRPARSQPSSVSKLFPEMAMRMSKAKSLSSCSADPEKLFIIPLGFFSSRMVMKSSKESIKVRFIGKLFWLAKSISYLRITCYSDLLKASKLL